jgi:hypothetical protein
MPLWPARSAAEASADSSAWKAGDTKPVFPYGRKSMKQVMKEMAGAVDQYAGAATH